jgi:hypothetical protein
MLLKPGWLIFLSMMWVVLQLLITIGDTANSISTMSQAPVIALLEATRATNSSTGQVSADFGAILTSLWSMLTFEANFLTGAWVMVRYFFVCIYGALGLSILFTFASSALNALGSVVGRIFR